MGLLSLLNIPLALGILSVIFMLIGFVVPMWISLSDLIHLGLWYVLLCTDDDCDNVSFDSNVAYEDIDNNNLFGAIRWIHSIVFALAIVGTFVLCFVRCQISLSKTVLGVACFLFSVAGIGMLVVIGIFVSFHMDKVPDERIVTALNFPWSMLMSGIGGFFAIASAFALMVMICSEYWYDYDDYRDKHGYDNRRYDDHSSYSGRHHHDHQDHHDHHHPHHHERHHDSHHYRHHDHDDYVKRPSPYHENHYHHQSDKARVPHYSDNMYRPYGLRRY